MKTLQKILLSTLIGGIIFLNGCDHMNGSHDNRPPSPPTNVYSVTGDNRIDIFWDYNTEHDVAGYNIYYSYTYNGKYTLIGSSHNNSYIDYGAENGVTYYYAVTAYDYDGNESDLSKDEVYDTPRPEGFNQTIFDYQHSANNSGYDFSKYLVLPYNDDLTDFFFENYNGQFYVNVWDDSEIQDMGSTSDIWDISYAPLGGWIPLKQNENVKYAPAVAGHTYVIRTWDLHYAKVRIKSITSDKMVFDWAYQLVEGNRELKRGETPETRNSVPAIVEKRH